MGEAGLNCHRADLTVARQQREGAKLEQLIGRGGTVVSCDWIRE